jgi:hypothetical protein
MTIKSLQSTSLTNNIFYRSMLAGNDAFFPEFESDEFLEEVVLTSSASSVTFSGLGAYSDYKHLQLRAIARTDAATSSTAAKLNFNSDTGANYAQHRIGAAGSSVFSSAAASQNNGTPFSIVGTDISDAWGVGIMDILDFSSAYKNTTVRTLGGYAGGLSLVDFRSDLYISTSAITQLQLTAQSGSFIAGSRFSLYGSKG